MKKLIAIYLAIAGLCYTSSAWCQTSQLKLETLQEKALLYSKINAKGLLFVHTDKTAYTNNESIWFAGYLINAGPANLDEHTLLAVSLMREDDRQIICSQQNVMSTGLGNGSLLIPDNTPPGNYIFNAYTNVLDQNGRPIALFSQPVTVKSITKRSFNASLRLIDTVINNGLIRANIALDIKDEKRYNTPTVTYGLMGGKKQKISLSEKESSVNITLKEAQITGIEPILLAQIAYYFDTLYLSVKLPKIQAKGINVRFMPEGGNLSNGLETIVALETTTADGLQVPVSGILYSDNEPVDTITTNSYGIASFKLKPNIKNRYTFKIKNNSYLDRDSVYKLPDAIDNGLVMRFKEAVIKDTLLMKLYSNTPRNVQVVVHNYTETFSHFTSYAYPQGKNLSLVMSALPKGLATVTILDEAGRPLAERIFFAHYNLQAKAIVTTHKQLFGKRDSVAVTLSLKDENGQPLQGMVSVAAVQENRLQGIKRKYIDNYVLIENELGHLPPDPLRRGIDNKNFLEDMLLTRGWRRYTWQGLMAGNVTDTVKIGPAPQFKGKILLNGHKLRKPQNVLALPNAANITTDADGTFVLQQQQIEVPERKKVFFWIDKKNVQGYELTTSNPFNAIDHQVSHNIVIKGGGTARLVDNSQDQEFTGFSKNNLLNVVNIKAKKQDQKLFGAAAINDCGDYVCETNFLNCPFDPPAYLPVKGKRYLRVDNFGKRMPSIVYEGCTSNGQPGNAVYTAREFYGLNRNEDNALEPQYLSTLFWKPRIATNEKGEASFSFFTGDIEGPFKIVAQGVGTDDVFYGESGFSVK